MRWLHFWRSHKTFSGSLTPQKSPGILATPQIVIWLCGTPPPSAKPPSLLSLVIQLASVSKKLRCTRKFKWLDQRLLADLTPAIARIQTSSGAQRENMWLKLLGNSESCNNIILKVYFFQCAQTHCVCVWLTHTKCTNTHFAYIFMYLFLCFHFPILVAS